MIKKDRYCGSIINTFISSKLFYFPMGFIIQLRLYIRQKYFPKLFEFYFAIDFIANINISSNIFLIFSSWIFNSKYILKFFGNPGRLILAKRFQLTACFPCLRVAAFL